MSGPTQDFIILAGLRSPGKAVVRGCNSPRGWDVQQGYGITGATVIFTGEGLAKFEVDVYAWEQSHFDAWKAFARATLMAPAPVRNPKSLSIEHPQLNDPPLSVTQVVVEDVTQWEQDEEGLWVRTIKFLQYRPRKPVLVKTLQGPPGNPLAVQAPKTPEERTIEALNAQIEDLSK